MHHVVIDLLIQYFCNFSLIFSVLPGVPGPPTNL